MIGIDLRRAFGAAAIISALVTTVLLGCSPNRSNDLPEEMKLRLAIAKRLKGEQRRSFLVYVNAKKHGMLLVAQSRTVSGAISVGHAILVREQRELAENRMAIDAMRNSKR